MRTIVGPVLLPWLLVPAVLAACVEGTSPVPDDGGAVTADVADDVPAAEPLPLVSDCGVCHQAADRAGPPAARVATRAWMEARGAGLVREDPVFPQAVTRWAVPWARRGGHAGSGDCAPCHPLKPDGSGHGVRTFPDRAAVFQPATDCAPACHDWIPDEGPGALLAAGADGHARLWREGVVPADGAAYRIAKFNPGCGGCHQVVAEDHGHVPSCLDCHAFGGPGRPLHEAHVQAIVAGADRNDPGARAEGVSFCVYCHEDPGGPSPRSRATCWGCHRSAHAPLDGEGRPQFWP